MRNHTKLRAFELADDLTVMIYKITISFPKEEIYGLTSQMRRAAVSVTSNIVEGCARESQLEYRRFLEIAFGSLRELNYQFNLAIKLGFINGLDSMTSNCKSNLTEAEKVLGSLIRSMR
jgi:four helix bundle protein